jgi:restriction endonuclease Mrr
MDDSKGNRFTKYFALLLDALRFTDPTPMRPAEARAWIRAKMDVAPDDLTRLIANKKQSIFENDVHWARFYLAKADLVSKLKRGLWGLTAEGRDMRLTPEATWALYVRIRDANRAHIPNNEEDEPPEAPDAEEENPQAAGDRRRAAGAARSAGIDPAAGGDWGD